MSDDSVPRYVSGKLSHHFTGVDVGAFAIAHRQLPVDHDVCNARGVASGVAGAAIT